MSAAPSPSPCTVAGCTDGYIRTGERDYSECVCRARARMRAYLGDLLLPAKPPEVASSPLIERVGDRRRARSMNAVITASWETMRAHAANALCASAPSFIVMSDAELRRLYFGEVKEDDEANPKAGGSRSWIATISHPEILILRVGKYRQRNKAIANVIYETLCDAREHKDTWLVIEPRDPWTREHPAWSPDLDAYLRDPTLGRPFEFITLR